MTHCYNCGHAGTFVLLVEFALAVPGPLSDPAAPDARVEDRGGDPGRRTHSRRPDDRRPSDRRPNDCRPSDRRRRDSPGGAGRRPDDASGWDDRDRRPREFPGRSPLPTGTDLPTGGGLSLAVQCPVCDSTDVGVDAADLLARYGSSTTS